MITMAEVYLDVEIFPLNLVINNRVDESNWYTEKKSPGPLMAGLTRVFRRYFERHCLIVYFPYMNYEHSRTIKSRSRLVSMLIVAMDTRIQKVVRPKQYCQYSS